MKLILTLYLAHCIQNTSISTSNKCKILIRYFTLFKFKIFEFWSIFYIYRTSQFGLVTFQVLTSPMCVVVITLERAKPEDGDERAWILFFLKSPMLPRVQSFAQW